jgi:hypothetical protein
MDNGMMAAPLSAWTAFQYCGMHAKDGETNTTNSPNLSGEARP